MLSIFKVYLLLFSSIGMWAASDKVDLQWSLCESNPERVAQKLGLDSSSDSTVSYYENVPLSYLAKGLFLRSKAGEKGKMETTVKVRAGTGAWPKGDDCQWDAYGSEEFFTCEKSETRQKGTELWSEEQKDFAAVAAPVIWGGLKTFGPYPLKKWKGKWGDYKVGLDSVEFSPNKSPLVELSVKTGGDGAESVRREVYRRFSEQRISLCEVQEPKTHRLFRSLGLL